MHHPIKFMISMHQPIKFITSMHQPIISLNQVVSVTHSITVTRRLSSEPRHSGLSTYDSIKFMISINYPIKFMISMHQPIISLKAAVSGSVTYSITVTRRLSNEWRHSGPAFVSFRGKVSMRFIARFRLCMALLEVRGVCVCAWCVTCVCEECVLCVRELCVFGVCA